MTIHVANAEYTEIVEHLIDGAGIRVLEAMTDAERLGFVRESIAFMATLDEVQAVYAALCRRIRDNAMPAPRARTASPLYR